MRKKEFFRSLVSFVIGAALFMAVAAHGRAKENQAEPQSQPETVAGPSLGDEQVQPDAVKAEEKKAEQYWIGVNCVAPIPEIVLAHLDVPKDSGVFVVDVVPDGPAAKAGIARNDIILAVAGAPLARVADLAAAVAASKGKPLAMEIIHAGKRQKVEVAPQARPAGFATKDLIDLPPGSKWNKLGQWFDETMPGIDGRPPLRMRFMHPGIILPPGARNQPPLPEGLMITITRKADGPAQIVVKRNNDTWEITEDDLDKLPPDIRPHVAQMLGGIAVPTPGEIKQSFQSHFQEQIDAMNRQMGQLKELAEQLREERLLLDRQKDADSKDKPEAAPSEEK